MEWKRSCAALGLGAALTLAAGTSHAASLTATDATFGTFDESRGTRTLTITGGGSITDVNIRIDFAKCDDPAAQPGDATCPSPGEEFSGETFFYLISPSGTRVDLVYTYDFTSEGIEQGSTKADGTYDLNQNVGVRIQVLFDDAAGAGVGAVMTTGSFRPEEFLAAFNSENPLGNWLLGMGDSVGGDPLSYFSAQLDITTLEEVPEPSTWLLLATGLVGLLGYGWRRRVA